MEILLEIREYLIQEDGKKYSVRHNMHLDTLYINEILLNEAFPDRNTLVFFDAPDDFKKKVFDSIKKNKNG
jgi:hypothetical protein